MAKKTTSYSYRRKNNMDEQIEYLFKLACLDPNFTEEFAHLEEPLYVKNNRKQLAEIMGEDVIEQIEQMVEKSKIHGVVTNKAISYNVGDIPKYLDNYRNGILDIRLDFTQVNSIDKLKDELDIIIDSYWYGFKKEKDHKVKKDTKDFKLIYLVGTWKEVEKKSWLEITMHPEFPHIPGKAVIKNRNRGEGYSEYKKDDPKRKARKLYADYIWMVRGGGWKYYRKHLQEFLNS
jgi:hypothetical protein